MIEQMKRNNSDSGQWIKRLHKNPATVEIQYQVKNKQSAPFSKCNILKANLKLVI
jgi:hypothetical protein